MGLLKHGQEQDRAQQFDLSHSKAVPLRHKLKRLLGKKRNDSVKSSVGSHPPSNHEDTPIVQSLWDRAYDLLRENESKLVGEYEKLLSKYAQETVSGSNEGSAQAVPLEDVSRGINRLSPQAQLKGIISAGLQRMKENKTTYTIAGHEFNLSNQIDKAASLVQWAKEFVGEAARQSPEASIAWAGVCIILPLLTNPKVADEANSDGFAYVTTRMQYYTELEHLLQRLGSNAQVSPALMVEANNQIVQLYHHILEFQIQSVLRFYQNRPRRYASDMILTTDWKKMVDKIKEFEGTIDKTLTQVNQLIARQELESLRNKSGESLRVMQQLLSNSQRQIRLVTEHRDIARRGLEIQEDKAKQKLSNRQNECLQLFRLADSKKDVTYEWYKERVEDRVQGTCEWFLKHENFQRWLEQDSGPLLVSADPGCGKSVLAKYLIDQGLPRSLPCSSTICYFFFKDQDQNTSCQALCALLHQLFSQKPFLIEHATRQFDLDGKNIITSTSSLWKVLKDAVGDPQAGHIVIVLDALDECAESEFQDLMRNIENQFHNNQSNHNKLRYLLSRPYEQIVSKFQHFLETFPYVHIPGEEESETISQEINQVIKYRVDKLAKEKRLAVQIKDHLAEKLLAIPHRTYLWVYLVFDYLEREAFKKTQRGIDSTIAILPKNIYQAYENILNKSKEEDPVVRRALSVIIAATRPLTIAEMNVALNVDYTSKSLQDLDLEEEEDFKSRLRSLCGLFISIYNGRIYFLHQTAREFLLGQPLPASIPLRGHWQHSINSRGAHRVLAEICIIYLDLLNYEEIPIDVNSYTFLDYSATTWTTHFDEACICEDSDIIPFVLRICDQESRSRSAWLGIYWKTTDVKKVTPTTVTNLGLSSHMGHEVVVKILLEQGADLECRDEEFGNTPLFWAAQMGHDGVVKLLLDNNADIEGTIKEMNFTPLFVAAAAGRHTTVKLLLENNADPEARDMLGMKPLNWAMLNKHEEAIKILLDIEDDINAPIGGWPPLCYAAEGGWEGVVQLLLDRNVDLTAKEEIHGQLALFIAVWKGRGGVVKLLLEQGAEYEYKAYNRAVLAAAKFGRTGILRMLLENDVDLDFAEDMFDLDKEDMFKDPRDLHNGYTPLLWAVGGGLNSIRLLLEKGANIEAQSADGETALLLAARYGDEADLKMLLEKGANVEFRSANGETALSLATAHDHEETVKVLLEMGADPTSSIGFSTLIPVAHIPKLKHLQST
ncbi:ankyrin [Xylaria arbuscula]|nr:ankyrin [Xylaria arbuscula]